MPMSKYHLNEFRMRKYQKDSYWTKYNRIQEMKKLRIRCQNVRPASDMTCPHYSTHILINRQRAHIEEVLGGAKNWIGKFKDEPKHLADARPWRTFNSSRVHPAPFSTLAIDPRGDKLRVIERNLMEMYARIKEAGELPSEYSPKPKKTYLSRGDSPYAKPPPKPTAKVKLERIKKWEMKHHPKAKKIPVGFFASLFGHGTEPRRTKIYHPTPPWVTRIRPVSPPAPTAKSTTKPAPAPKPEAKAPELEPQSISSVTQEEADKDEKLAQLKAVQEAGGDF